MTRNTWEVYVLVWYFVSTIVILKCVEVLSGISMTKVFTPQPKPLHPTSHTRILHLVLSPAFRLPLSHIFCYFCTYSKKLKPLAHYSFVN